MNTMFCQACSDHHELFYLIGENGVTRHMVYRCPKHGVKAFHRINGLNLRTEYCRKWHKKKQEERQQKLF